MSNFHFVCHCCWPWLVASHWLCAGLLSFPADAACVCVATYFLSSYLFIITHWLSVVAIGCVCKLFCAKPIPLLVIRLQFVVGKEKCHHGSSGCFLLIVPVARR